MNTQDGEVVTDNFIRSAIAFYFVTHESSAVFTMSKLRSVGRPVQCTLRYGTCSFNTYDATTHDD